MSNTCYFRLSTSINKIFRVKNAYLQQEICKELHNLCDLYLVL